MRVFTGKQYLDIAIANAYGMDKRSWDERLDWVERNRNDLEKYITVAADPHLYAKAVVTYYEVKNKNPTGYIMGLDATASGLQIMAILAGCEDTARAVNLIDTGKREDVYEEIATLMRSISVDVTRKDVKKPVMTHYYGSKRQPETVFGEDSPELEAFYNTLNTLMPGAEGLMNDMQSCWNPEATEYRWTLPDEHVVVMKVMVPEDKRIEIDELGHATFTYRSIVNKAKTKGRSLAANIVHSIDGYIVREMSKRCDTDGFDMLAIHDSFWASPNHMNAVRRHYVTILAEIADSNLMEDIFRELTGDPSIAYTKITNDLSKKILDSDYALS